MALDSNTYMTHILFRCVHISLAACYTVSDFLPKYHGASVFLSSFFFTTIIEIAHFQFVN